MIIDYNTNIDCFQILDGIGAVLSFLSRGSIPISVLDNGVGVDSIDVIDISEQRRKYRFSAMAERAMLDWVTHAVSCNESINWNGSVIWDKPGEDRPDKPYIALNLINEPTVIGGPDKKYYSLDTWIYTYRESIMLSVSVCADNGYMYYMNKILDSVHKECCYKYLRQAGLAYWMHYGPFDVSYLVDAEFEFRVNANIVLSFGHVEYVKDGEIHKVKVNDWPDIELP